MKTTILILAMVFVSSLATFAQESKHKNGNFPQKELYIKQHLELSAQEEKDLFRLLEEREKERKETIKKLKEERGKRKKLEDMTDKEVVDLLNKTLEIKQAQLDIQKKYNSKFLEVLPPKKVAKLYHLEKEFRKQKREKREKAGMKQ